MNFALFEEPYTPSISLSPDEPVEILTHSGTQIPIAAAILQNDAPLTHPHPCHAHQRQRSSRNARPTGSRNARERQVAENSSLDAVREEGISYGDLENETITSGDLEKCREAVVHSVVSALKGKKTLVLSFRAIQLHRMEMLQDILVSIQSEMAEKLRKAGTIPEQDWKRLDEALGRYANSLRNFETLSKNSVSKVPSKYQFLGRAACIKQNNPDDGVKEIFKRFFIKSATTADERGLEQDCEVGASSFADERARYESINCFGKPGYRELDQAGRREREARNRFFGRVLMGGFGGIIIMLPVSILSVHVEYNLETVLIIIGTFIFLFSILISYFGHRSTGQTVLAQTACYAAILVMFIEKLSDGSTDGQEQDPMPQV